MLVLKSRVTIKIGFERPNFLGGGREFRPHDFRTPKVTKLERRRWSPETIFDFQVTAQKSGFQIVRCSNALANISENGQNLSLGESFP